MHLYNYIYVYFTDNMNNKLFCKMHRHCIKCKRHSAKYIRALPEYYVKCQTWSRNESEVFNMSNDK